MKMYIPVEGNEYANYIKVYTYYDLGGINPWTYKTDKRGYYVTCIPVKREGKGAYATESFTVGSGYKQLCKEVTRQSKKAAAEAEVIAAKLYEAIVQKICKKEGLTIKEEVA